MPHSLVSINVAKVTVKNQLGDDVPNLMTLIQDTQPRPILALPIFAGEYSEILTSRKW